MSRENLEAVSATQFILFLHSAPHLGEKSLARVIRLIARERLTAEACLQLSEDGWIERFDLDPRVAMSLVDGRASLIHRSAELARTLRAHSVQVITLADASYPDRLERNDDAPPPILYSLGKTALLDPASSDRFNFAVAVSNGASPRSMAWLDTLGSAIVESGGVPVTGHDRPPYKRLALCAQRRNRPILYVFDRGMREALGPQFDRPPFSAARIRDAVFETDRDLAVSPFRLDDHSIGANNVRRDRLIFALADVIIALDVRPGGVMEAECLRAHRQGRRVFVAPVEPELGVEATEAIGGSGCSRLREAGCAALSVGAADAASAAEAAAQILRTL